MREALRLNPRNPEAHGTLGNILADQGKVDEAIAEYRESLRLKPESADAHNNLGKALYMFELHLNLGSALHKAGSLATRSPSPRSAASQAGISRGPH